MLKVRTLFSGIGAPEKALEMLNVPYELVDFCEVDKYAVKSYCAVHNVSEDKNLGDISKVDETTLPYADLMVWGFPCSDISVAGHQLGIVEGKTRSGLYYEGLRILKATLPKYSIIENVKNLVGKKFKAEFDQMLKDLEDIGYVNYWKVLNAKNFGVAQNRERVFIVSIRKDVDTGEFEFPVGFDNGLRLKDFLEDEVDEKFYLSDEYVERFKKSLEDKALQNKIPHEGVYTVLGTTVNPEAKGTNSRHWVYDTDKLSSCLAATDYKQPKQILVDKKNKINVLGNMSNTGHHGLDVYSDDGISPTLKARDFKDPVRVMRADTATAIRLGGIFDTETKHQAGSIWDTKGIAPTLDTMQGGYRQPSIIEDFRIRKLTPKECWLLMGFDAASFERAAKVNSNSQLYKQAGNSIVTHVLCAILKNLLKIK